MRLTNSCLSLFPKAYAEKLNKIIQTTPSVIIGVGQRPASGRRRHAQRRTSEDNSTTGDDTSTVVAQQPHQYPAPPLPQGRFWNRPRRSTTSTSERSAGQESA